MDNKKKKKPVPPAKEDDKKKRGRRPKIVYDAANIAIGGSSTTATAEQVPSSMLSDDENIIVRLNVTDDNRPLSTLDFNEDVDDEQPYAYNTHDYLSLEKFKLPDEDESVMNYDMCAVAGGDNDSEIDKSSVTTRLRVVELLKDFEEKNKNHEWPMNTSIACYWCCHRFNNAPYGIPVEYFKDNKGRNEHFRVFGCFCSLECATSYNFNDHQNHDEIWERYNLINLLSRRLGYKKLVKAAPDRMALKLFGGFMDIEQFRTFCNTSKLIHVNFPPMTSITQQIEEINEYEMNSEVRYIPIDNDRINRYKEKIIFKRPKANGQEKSMLEHAMNMKFIT